MDPSTTKAPLAAGLPTPHTAGKFCILGAGSSGLTIAKNFKQHGIPFDCLEREDDVGGIWRYGAPASSIYRSTHLISSKKLTEYTDFPMPQSYPEYPHHELVWDYLRSYAQHFELYDTIEFNTSIERVERAGDDGWNVQINKGRSRRELRRYRGVVIANGHHWDPRQPELPGRFDGLQLHSAEYKTPEMLEGRRVLVIGAGNSGCDIAVESAQHAARTYHSMRRGYYFLPKFFRGFPIDQVGERMLRWHVPLFLRRWLAIGVSYLALGDLRRIGFPAADHRLFETHPIVNSQLAYHVAHGDVTLKPDVAELRGDRVRFTDGSEVEVDLIIYATGFNITFPFIDQSELHWRDGRPDLFLNLFHPERDDLFVAGLIQPDSGLWGLVDYQGQLIAAYLQGLDAGAPAARRFQQRKHAERPRLNHGIGYLNSPRHLLEVEHFAYRKRLQRELRTMK